MKSITREWLQKTIAEFETTCDEIPFGMDDDDAKILQVLKLKLASLEAEEGAEPVAKVDTVGVCWYADNGVARKPAVGTELYIAPSAPSATVDELTMWVKRLTHSLRSAKPDSKLPDEAMAYLSKKGLISVTDVLR